MRQLLTIFGFSLRRGLRKQSFWLSNVIMMVLILILCLIPFLQNLRGQGSGEGSRPESVTAEDLMEAERQAVNRVGTCYYIDELGQIPEGIAAQAEQSCRNVAAILEETGLTMEHVIKTTCFLADIADFAAFNEVYAKYFVSCPARSCVAVKDIPKGCLCEIEAIAAK